MKAEIEMEQLKEVLRSRSKNRTWIPKKSFDFLTREQPMFDIPEESFHKLKQIVGNDIEIIPELVNFAIEQFIDSYEEKNRTLTIVLRNFK